MRKQIKIGDKKINNNNCLIIAEAGVNHNGSIIMAEKLIKSLNIMEQISSNFRPIRQKSLQLKSHQGFGIGKVKLKKAVHNLTHTKD